MLKWTVSKRSDLTESLSVKEKSHTPSRRSLGSIPIRNREHREHRRKSTTSIVTRRYLNQNKENQIVATPHPLTQRTTTSTPFPKIEFALRDVSNRTPTQTTTVNNNSMTPGRKRNLPPSPVTSVRTMHVQPQQQQTYASTLPTLDLEYSPCGIKSGPLIALRGLTVPDTFFGNACYFRDDMPPASKRLKFTPEITPLSRKLSELRFSKMSIKRRHTINNNFNDDEEEEDTNISSKALNDTELDKMIDEILESSRKVKHSSLRRYSPPPATPIRPCDTRTDPDTVKFDKFCDNLVLSPTKIVEAADHTIILEDPATYKEREVRTPDIGMEVCQEEVVKEDECHLKRQKGVRRKHTKTKKPTEKHKTAEQSPPTRSDDLMRQNSFLRKSIDLLACMNTPKDLRRDSDRASMKNRCHTSIGSKSSYESTPGIEANDVQGSSTPTSCQTTIRRCLTFSESPDSMEDSMDKRKSVASSITSRCSKSTTVINGSLDLAITVDDTKIQIHGELLMV